MIYENWREAIRHEYITMVSLSHFLNGAGQTRMKVLEILYLLSEQCQTSEQLLNRVDRQELPVDDLNLIMTHIGLALVDALRNGGVSCGTDCN